MASCVSPITMMSITPILWYATREYRLLPQPHYHTWTTTCLGFGFDPKTNDYKVLRVATHFESDLKSFDCDDDFDEGFDTPVDKPVDLKAQIYGMCSDSWKEIVAMVPNHTFNSCPCRCTSLDGVFYWLGYGFPTCVPVIHGFRMFEELFEQISLPLTINLVKSLSFVFLMIPFPCRAKVWSSARRDVLWHMVNGRIQI